MGIQIRLERSADLLSITLHKPDISGLEDIEVMLNIAEETTLLQYLQELRDEKYIGGEGKRRTVEVS